MTSTYVGASSDVVETAVTIPLEQELNGVEGMRYMSSTSGNDGVSTITITFEPSRDIEVAAVDVQNRVSRASSRLPAQVNQTGIVVNKASSQLLMGMGLFSPDGRYDSKFLSNYADVNLKDALKRIRGVGEVRIFGERKFSMRLWLDPTELARRQLTAQDVMRALQEQNLQVAAGQVGQPPSNANQPYQIAVRARGRLVEPEEFGEIVVQRSPDGQVVRLGDVGRTELGAENYGQFMRFNGRNAVGIGIFQLPTANALDVRDAVVAEMERLSKQFPPGLEYQPGTDTTLAVRASIKEVAVTLAEAIALVILVIFVFLHGWRSVLITALTLPVSLLGTFAFVKLFGFSINTLTLFGLTLATGLVVDDAIVVIENIERLMQQKKLGAFEAARREHARGNGRRDRDLDRADRGVRAGLVLPRHHRRHLPPVRADDRRLGRDLDLLRADLDPRAERALAAPSAGGKVGRVPQDRKRPRRAARRATAGCSGGSCAIRSRSWSAF